MSAWGKGLCLNCGQEGHFARECPSTKPSTNSGGRGGKPRPQVSLTTLRTLDQRDSQGNGLVPSDEDYLETPEANLMNETANKLIFVNVLVNDTRVAVLVDTGATANFVKEGEAKRLGLKICEMNEPIVCKFSNGQRGIVTKVVQNLRTEVPGDKGSFVSRDNFYVLPNLGGVDMILSIAYLRRHCVTLEPGAKRLLFPVRGQEPVVVTELSVDNKDKLSSIHTIQWIFGLTTSKSLWKDYRKGADILQFQLYEQESEETSEVPEVGGAVGSEEAKLRVGTNLAQLQKILKEYKDVFRDKLPSGLPPRRDVDHKIELEPGSAPMAKAPYRMNLSERKVLQETLAELIDAGFIRPSASPYGAPALFVSKKDASLRLCVDYRALNKMSKRNAYPLPHQDDLFHSMVNARYFTRLDLKSGYWQIRIAVGDEEKTAFRTRFGSYEFLVMPFGLTNASSTFMRMMDSIFHDLLDNGVVVFIDDILIYAQTLEEHELLLAEVLKRLRKAHLYVNPKKCNIAVEEVEFLGHTFSKEGIRPSTDKCAAIKDWQRPTSVTETRSFVGFVQFYRRYIKDFAKLARPLTSLSRKNQVFVWTQVCENAFLELKKAMVSPPILKLPEFGKPFEVWTDSSDFAIGGCLHQDGRPVAFESCKLENSWPTHEREMYAIIYCIRKWEYYLRRGTQVHCLLGQHRRKLF